MSIRPLPWATLSAVLAALLLRLRPDWAVFLILERDAVAKGQVWRFWSGHWVHFNSSHLLWNVIVVAAAGVWLESLEPRLTRLFWILAPPIVAAAALVGHPTLDRYAGLSGVAAGLLVALALREIAAPTGSRAVWVAVLAMVAAKLVAERMVGEALLADGVRPVPLAHLAGAACGAAAFAAVRRGSRGRPSPPRRR